MVDRVASRKIRCRILAHLARVGSDGYYLGNNYGINKPDRATMRPDCVSACIDHVTYMERQMDEQTSETTE